MYSWPACHQPSRRDPTLCRLCGKSLTAPEPEPEPAAVEPVVLEAADQLRTAADRIVARAMRAKPYALPHFRHMNRALRSAAILATRRVRRDA